MAADPKDEKTTEKVKKANPGDWRDPKSTFDDDDHSLDAEMWRLANQEPVHS